MALTFYHLHLLKVSVPGEQISVIVGFFFLYCVSFNTVLSLLHLPAEHSGQTDQEDQPGSGGREQQLEGAVC